MIASFAANSGLATWGSRVLYSTVDQGLYSGTNFLLNIMLIRWLTGAEFGQFALAFAAFILLSGIHNSILLEPLGVLGSTVPSEDFPSYVGHLYIIHIGLCVTVSLTTLVGTLFMPSSELRLAGMTMACAFPFILLSWVTRRICYVLSIPRVAAIGSVTYLIVLLSLLIFIHVIGTLNASTPFSLMAIASLASALIMMLLLPVDPTFAFDRNWTVALRKTFLTQWSLGKWVALQTLFTLGATHLPIFVAGLAVGVSSAGVFRVLQLVAQPVLQVMTAVGGMLALPILAKDYARENYIQAERRVFRISLAFTGMTFGYLLLLIVMRGPITDFIGGPSGLTSPGLIPLYGLVPVIAAVGTGAGIALRAAQKMAYYPLSTGIPGAVGLIATPLMIGWWGVLGGIVSVLLTTLVLTCLSIMLYRTLLSESVE